MITDRKQVCFAKVSICGVQEKLSENRLRTPRICRLPLEPLVTGTKERLFDTPVVVFYNYFDFFHRARNLGI